MLDTPGARNAVKESPTFVHTRDNYDDDNVSHAMTAEQGYEFGYTPQPVVRQRRQQQPAAAYASLGHAVAAVQ